jgi:hypothetical protein
MTEDNLGEIGTRKRRRDVQLDAYTSPESDPGSSALLRPTLSRWLRPPRLDINFTGDTI